MANNIVVYTAISGARDILKDGQCNLGADFVAFLDEPCKSEVWDVRPINQIDRDPNRNAKQYKILPHKVLPQYEYSLWIDGSIELAVPVQRLIDLYLKDTNVAHFKHPTRDCAFNEAVACDVLKKDDSLILLEQMGRYTKEGFPDHYGLNECTILLRRHNAPEVIEFNEMWWNEIDKGSRRDQISYPYCLWKTGLKATTIPGSIETKYGDARFPGNDYFVYTKHIKT